MTKLIKFNVLLFFVSACTAPQLEARDNGGAIFYTDIQGEHFILLADHVGGTPRHLNRGWAGFGGRGVKSDSEEFVLKRESNKRSATIMMAV